MLSTGRTLHRYATIVKVQKKNKKRGGQRFGLVYKDRVRGGGRAELLCFADANILGCKLFCGKRDISCSTWAVRDRRRLHDRSRVETSRNMQNRCGHGRSIRFDDLIQIRRSPNPRTYKLCRSRRCARRVYEREMALSLRRSSCKEALNRKDHDRKSRPRGTSGGGWLLAFHLLRRKDRVHRDLIASLSAINLK